VKIPRFKGRWRNVEQGVNYWMEPIPGKPRWFEYSQNPIAPPYFYNVDDGSKWFLPQRFDTDGGSVPSFLHWLVDPLEYPWAFLYHDAACQLRTRCLWVQAPDSTVQVKVTFKRSQADTALFDWLTCLHTAWIRRQTIYYAVRAWALATGQWK